MSPAALKSLALATIGLAVAACSDVPTGVGNGNDVAHAERVSDPADAIGHAGSSCLLSRRAAGGTHLYSYRRVRGIRLPATVAAPGGSTTVLRITFQSPGLPVFAQVNCRIPNSPAAVSLMLQTFVGTASTPSPNSPRRGAGSAVGEVGLFVDPKRRAPQVDSDPEGGSRAGTPRMDTGCVTGGSCALPGITVYSYPAPSYTDPYGACYWGCGWNASAGDYGGGDYYDPGTPPDADGPQNCNTGDAVVDNPATQAEMKTLWQSSNYSPSTPQNQRLEQYAWVVYQNGVYSFPTMGIPPAPCGFEGDVHLDAPPGAVGFVHTHPWAVGEIQTSCGAGSGMYLGLPSEDDVAASRTLGLPGWIIDASKVTRFDARSGTTPVNAIDMQVTRCGY